MKYCLLILGLLFSVSVFSQAVKGRVIDDSGKPVAAASIFIKETKQGLIANTSGEFQVKLSSGNYHLETRCIGYETDELEVSVAGEELDLIIVLKNKDLQLQEVEIRPGEDPAYEIMRQAIKKAPYYQSVIKESRYETYTKGSGKLTHIPKLIQKMSDGEMYRFEDKLFMQESFNEMKFTAPDKFEQKVIAYSNTFPNMNDPEKAMGIGMVSLYYPMFASVVSPLNPKAFDYYRFRYEGYEEEDNQIINKIRIIPKLKDPKLMEGIIYIADDEWNIRHADITTHPIGLTAHYLLNYHPVVDNIYLVTTYELNANFNIFGMKIKADFLSSIQYKDIQLNDSLIALQKKNQPKKKKSLEIKLEDRVQKTVDSLAVNRDSLYWSEIRTVVLNEEELQSYERKDSMQAYTDSLRQAADNPKFKPFDLLMGGKLGNDSSLMYFRYSGVLGTISEYNYVDGWWLGQAFELDFKKKKNTGFILRPSIYWTSARKEFIWQTDISFDYAPKRLGLFNLSAGNITADYSGDAHTYELLGFEYLFLFGDNYAQFYGKKYGRLSNQIDLCNGLQVGLGVETAERRVLENHTTWNLYGIKGEWKSNYPDYDQPLNRQYNQLHQYDVHLKYTPEQYYRIHEEKKQYVRSRFPTFELDYRQGFLFLDGFPLNDDKASVFQRLELSVKQQLKLNLFSRLNYTLIAGKFLKDNAFNYIDYKHFSTTNSGLTFKSWEDSYALLPYYRYSTNQNWLQAFVNYNTDYLLLKRLPFLQGKFFTETLHANFLHTPEKKYYSEWGYSVDLPMGIGGAGIFVAFDSFQYNGIGVQISLPLFNSFGKSGKSVEISIGN
ncbi:membrane protein [Bacteroidia bacterium]|nr:membrane protein [Bacteroidia bacterium]GHT46064.1 membrane protein [Bacteroidia bacterium]